MFPFDPRPTSRPSWNFENDLGKNDFCLLPIYLCILAINCQFKFFMTMFYTTSHNEAVAI